MTRSAVCPVCGKTFKRNLTGRPRRFCVVCSPPGSGRHHRVFGAHLGRKQPSPEQRQRRLAREAACRAVAQLHPDDFWGLYVSFCAQRGVSACPEEVAR